MLLWRTFTLFWSEVTTWPGDMTFSDLCPKFSWHTERCINMCAKNGVTVRRCFFRYLRKTWGGGASKHPRPGVGLLVGDARARCKKGCQYRNNYNNSAITGPIALKLCMHVGTHRTMYLYVHMCPSWVLLHVYTWKDRSQRTTEPFPFKFGAGMGTG